MEQFAQDLRDIVLGIAHALAALVHLIGWIIDAIGWIFDHALWILAGVAVVVLGYHALEALEGRDIMALFKRKPADELEPATPNAVARAEMSDSQRAITDLVWAVRNNDAAEVNAAIKQIQQSKGPWPEVKPGHLTAEVTETETNTKTITVKKRLVVG